MKKMNARFAGTCRDCSGRFAAGTPIEYDRAAARGRKTRHVDCDAAGGEASAGYGDYGSASWNNRPTITFRTSGGTFSQRAGGRCEDAPCCGCCG